jgi:tetratricopeptide (TPR) repeat protein
VSRLTRRELKEDALRTAFEDYEAFAKDNAREIILAVCILAVAVGGFFGVRTYLEGAEAKANAQLGVALDTYLAYVGTPAPGVLGPGQQSFPTAEAKYAKALQEFQAVAQAKGLEKFLPELKVVRVARYHVGLCQAALGKDPAAIATFEKLTHDRDAEIASLGRMALAGEYAKTGKTAEAVKIYQDLADHPTSAVPKSTALLALASLKRATEPAQARQIYEQLAKQYADNPSLSEVLKQQISSLPQ